MYIYNINMVQYKSSQQRVSSKFLLIVKLLPKGTMLSCMFSCTFYFPIRESIEFDLVFINC